jgi:hypothetical protein
MRPVVKIHESNRLDCKPNGTRTHAKRKGMLRRLRPGIKQRAPFIGLVRDRSIIITRRGPKVREIDRNCVAHVGLVNIKGF